MEQSQKKARITGHFRVALKPQDVNVPNFKRFKKSHDETGKENNNHNQSKIEVITIEEDDSDNNKQLQLNENNNSGNENNNFILNNTTKSSKQQQSTLVDRSQITKPDISKYLIVDFDQSVINDILFEPHYAQDSFLYDRERELLFQSKNYLTKQEISPSMRAKLVDWLVFIQNNFSLDHEALYMAVKISDQYLMKKQCQKCYLPLLYLTSILISSKFEERIPPVSISELMEHVCRKYTRRQVLAFEAELLRALNFDIRFPLSYAFLRRFAICTKSDKLTLTLARYILESSLLEYNLIDIIESKIAAASLLLALKMLNLDDEHLNNRWDKTAIFYTGYEKKELYPILKKLNKNIYTDKVSRSVTRKKYSHQLFLHVAKVPPLSIEYLDELAGHDATTTNNNKTITTTTPLKTTITTQSQQVTMPQNETTNYHNHHHQIYHSQSTAKLLTQSQKF